MANILVIDDEHDVCEVLKDALEAKGHTVQTSQDTQDLSKLLASPPDLILLDVLMPDANGLEVLPKIQTLAPGSRILICTAVNDYRLADLFYESGVAGFLTKPLRLDALTTTVHRILNATSCTDP